MAARLTEAVFEVRVARAQGLEPAEIAERLHGRGFAIMTAIRAIREALGIPLGEAKEIVHGAPAWHREVEAGESLRREALQVLEELQD